MKTVTQVCFASMLLASIPINAQTAASPPTLGEETKGTPAISETSRLPEKRDTKLDAKPTTDNDEVPTSFADNLLGKAKIKESRRESGQVYLIELEHSSGSKQYIEENDSDGELSPNDNDLDSIPNLPKWKLGSW